jgi:hypothetical protein
MSANPITVYKVRGDGAQAPEIRRFAEDAGETFKQGTPVQIDADGFLIECAAITDAATAKIAGFSTEEAANLSSDGVAKTLTQGTVINQTNAVIIPRGVRMNDGTCGVLIATDRQTFVGKITAATALAQTLVDAKAGLTEDTNHFWYVDETKAAVAGGACVQILSLIDPIGTLGGRVEFRVLDAAQQFGSNAVGS